MRCIFLLLIAAYGGWIACQCQVDVTNSKSWAAGMMNCLLCYLLMVAIYLAINRMKDWKLLCLYSLVVAGFVAELVHRARANETHLAPDATQHRLFR